MKTMNVARGTARAKRRQDMARFKEDRAQRLASAALSTWTVSMATRRILPPAPAHRDVFTITNEGAGQFSAKLYEANKDYPWNAPCPRRNLLFNYGWMTISNALALRERKIG